MRRDFDVWGLVGLVFFVLVAIAIWVVIVVGVGDWISR